jgi:hypothetical protein
LLVNLEGGVVFRIIWWCFSDGVGASGLYLAMLYNMGKMKLEKTCDVCNAVRVVRSSNGQFMQKQVGFGASENDADKIGFVSGTTCFLVGRRTVLFGGSWATQRRKDYTFSVASNFIKFLLRRTLPSLCRIKL